MMIEYKLERVSDNAYAFIQGNGDWFLSNTGFIVGKDFVVVIDSLTSEKPTKVFKEEMRKIIGDKPVKYLINTHEHGDHIWTNHLFNATTISHKNCRRTTIEGMKSGVNPYEHIFKEVDFTGWKYTPQDVTVESEMSLWVDKDKEIKIIHPGFAHTRSDLFIYFPDEKVVFTGDLLFSPPCTPFALMGYLQGYIKTLEDLASLDADVYIPGHGGIAYDRKPLYEARDYLIFVRDEARKLMKRGIEDPVVASKEVSLGKYDSWLSKERIVGNMARAYSELKGGLPASPLKDMERIIMEMMKLRQGKTS
ncbi:MBL fold metallo-hydrolase [Sulfolobus acidocaldarius]|nr:MBL fold metallo-hydrolase [Sulfolobus acidocaldarius]